MKRFKSSLKKILTIAIISSILSSLNISTSLAGTKYTFEIWKSGGNGAWWNPFDEGFYSVFSGDYVYDDGHGNITIKHKVVCEGNGRLSFPENIVYTPTDTLSDWVPSVEYIDESYQMMQDYVYSQVELGNYSGTAQFNEIVQEIMIYRNVIWDCDSSQVKIKMNIFNEESPNN